MIKVAVLDGWQEIARNSTDWFPLMGCAEVVFFEDAFKDEDG